MGAFTAEAPGNVGHASVTGPRQGGWPPRAAI